MARFILDGSGSDNALSANITLPNVTEDHMYIMNASDSTINVTLELSDGVLNQWFLPTSIPASSNSDHIQEANRGHRRITVSHAGGGSSEQNKVLRIEGIQPRAYAVWPYTAGNNATVIGANSFVETTHGTAAGSGDTVYVFSAPDT